MEVSPGLPLHCDLLLILDSDGVFSHLKTHTGEKLNKSQNLTSASAIYVMGWRCRQIFLFIATFSFLRGLQVGFLSEGNLRIGYIGNLWLSGNKSDGSALVTTPAIPFSEVRKTPLSPLERENNLKEIHRKTALKRAPLREKITPSKMDVAPWDKHWIKREFDG